MAKIASTMTFIFTRDQLEANLPGKGSCKPLQTSMLPHQRLIDRSLKKEVNLWE
jgi:hypothetical protein